MTNAEAQARHEQFPHPSMETIAYYAGRNGAGCDFTTPDLIASYWKGVRDVHAEDRLDEDTEWDSDEDIIS